MSDNQKGAAGEANADELRAFVSSTLKAIFDGINDVQKEASYRSPTGSGSSTFEYPREVNFDVAISAKSAGKAKGGLKLEVFSVGANAGGEKHSEHSTVSRIQFAVPFLYRQQR